MCQRRDEDQRVLPDIAIERMSEVRREAREVVQEIRTEENVKMGNHEEETIA